VNAAGTASVSGASKVTAQQNAGGNRVLERHRCGVKVSVSQQGVKVREAGGRVSLEVLC
jgi:hypothetical protein